MIIGYKAFGRGSLNYGLDLCIEKIKGIDGIDLRSVSKHNASGCDVLLFSLYWWQHIYDYIDFLFEAGINPAKRKPLILIGGFQSFNFFALGDLFHYACIGDGEDFLPEFVRTLQGKGSVESIPGIYWPGKTSPTHWQNVAFDAISMEEPGRDVSRIEIARGCRYRCKFCALTYLKEYREGDTETIKSLIKNSDAKHIALFAPDRTSVTGFEEILEFSAECGKSDLASDARLDTMQKMKKLPSHLRIGIEGVSYRLRRAVGKNYTNEDVLTGFRKALNQSKNGKRGIHFYLILDLPGETDADYDELRDLFLEIDTWEECEGLTLMPFPNSFIPNPLTPMQWGGVNIFSDLSEKIKDVFRTKERWRYTLAWNVRLWGPEERLKSMIALRGDENATRILVNIARNPKLKSALGKKSRERAENLAGFCERSGMSVSQICGEWPTHKAFPWDSIETHVRKETLIRSWLHYKKQTGISDRIDLPMMMANG